MKKFAVIVAGGNGQRMKTVVPKQFLLLKSKPLLWYTLDTFLNAFNDLEIILVLPKDHLTIGERLRDLFQDRHRIKIISGGITRYHSVQNGLKLVSGESVIFVHDGVRCLISKDLIRRCYIQAKEMGSAIPAVPATDSIRITHGEKSEVADRNNIRIVQTPQTFRSELILPAFTQNYNESFTDESTVVEAYGKTIYLIEGDHSNIKITRPIDLLLAENILQERGEF